MIRRLLSLFRRTKAAKAEPFSPAFSRVLAMHVAQATSHGGAHLTTATARGVRG